MIQILLFTLLQLAHSHGEDHPGPHGGQIQMPGAFHTEVLSQNDKVQIYLLDMNFENPTVENSQVTAFFKSKDKKQKLVCEKGTNSYTCVLPKNRNKGELILETTRSGAKGNEAVYQWPIR